MAPRGVLLVGPPGTGKTLLAKALAGESKANFISVDGSFFTATFYGAGVIKVKALFKLARTNLFDLYIRKLAHDGRADTAVLARMTAGMSPADIANTVNKAASTAAEAHAPQVTSEHFLGAIATHQLGGEVSAIKELFTQDLRDRLAYHESGHALA